MKAEYLQRGETLDYTNVTEDLIPDGAVVEIGDRIGVTGCPIPPGKKGSLHVTGVFEMTKTGTAAIAQGQTVYFDGEGITDAAGNGKSGDDKVEYTRAGYAAETAEAAGTTVLVQIGG